MIPKAVRQLVWDRDGSMCALCGIGLTRDFGHVHHRKYRSRGGQDTVDNLVLLCEPHHTKVHAESMPGFAVSAYENPQLVPIRHWSGRDLYLLPDGTLGEQVWEAS